MLIAQRIHREVAHGFSIACVTARRREIFANFNDVFAAITVVWPPRAVRLDAFRTQLHRAGQVLDLIAGIVVIKLAMHRAALRFEQIAQRVAERGLTGVAGMQRAGGVGGDKFHQHSFATSRVA